MENVTLPQVDGYLSELLNFENEYLKNMRAYAQERDIPIVHKEVANLIRFLIQMHRPENVLEFGMAIGYSALLMLSSCDSVKKVTTFERNDWMLDRAKPFLAGSGKEGQVEIRFEDGVSGVKKLDGIYDFVFIDAVKSKYDHFLEGVYPHVRKGGLIVCDNVLFRGMICNDALVTKRDRTIVRSLRKFLAKIQNDRRFNTTILPIGEGVSISELR